MKTTLAAWIFWISFSLLAEQKLTEHDFGRIADAIYVIEGGTNARVAYGILSIKVRDADHAREICLNTIRNNHTRWVKSGQRGKFLDFLADRYCPKSHDAVGNRNWKRNIRLVLNSKALKEKALHKFGVLPPRVYPDGFSCRQTHRMDGETHRSQMT